VPRVPSSGLVLLTLLLSGCSPGAYEGVDESEDEDAEQVQQTRRVLLCMQGLSDRTTEWDKGLFALCEAVEDQGLELIRDGDFPAFGALDENGAYRALFASLDQNGDGWVDEDDPFTLVHLVGFSWGGINVTDLAQRLRKDKRVALARRGVAVMVLLDPYQPQRWSAPVPANVLYTWEYRQSETTSGDCSSTVSLGLGFNGLDPIAKSAGSTCSVYDLDGWLDDVGHCDVPVLATEAALHNLTRYEDYPPWADRGEPCEVD
jgi:pimeloyl-ACP methyl ester carboxylesterase